MPTPKPIGPVLKIVGPVVLAAIPAVAVATIWGLDWRWLVTTILTGLAVLLVGGFIDTQLERRRGQRLSRQLDATADDFLKALGLTDKDRP